MNPVQTSNLRIDTIRPIPSPDYVCHTVALSDEGANLVASSRADVVNIMNGDDDRLIVIVGPCSIHDPAAAIDYAKRLRKEADRLADDLCIVMRVYFEKPRTTVGWKGLINDPNLDGSYDIDAGLKVARRLLLDIVELGLPAGCEFLDTISPQYIADAVTWGAIGARTTESQVHRELASGLSMPVGFKNGTDGSIQIAIDALRAAAHPHSFLSVKEHGGVAIVSTKGNQDTHVILRGSNKGINFDPANVHQTLEALRKVGLPARLMIDASHGNSDKDYRKQPAAAHAVAEQLATGERGIIGIMLESFLVDGRQDLKVKADLVYGQSITDACIGWDATVPVLDELAAAVRARRAAAKQGEAAGATAG